MTFAALVYAVASYAACGFAVAVIVALWIKGRYRPSAVRSFALLGGLVWPFTLILFVLSAAALTWRDRHARD